MVQNRMDWKQSLLFFCRSHELVVDSEDYVLDFLPVMDEVTEHLTNASLEYKELTTNLILIL